MSRQLDGADVRQTRRYLVLCEVWRGLKSLRLKHPGFCCLEDGKTMKTLKRHLMTEHGMTPGEYRQRWGLAADYPMVAPEYAETRRALSTKIGLGRKSNQKRGRRKSSAPKRAPAKSTAAK